MKIREKKNWKRRKWQMRTDQRDWGAGSQKGILVGKFGMWVEKRNIKVNTRDLSD